jgi:hypothetical protein
MIAFIFYKAFDWANNIVYWLFFWFILDEIGASDLLYKLYFVLLIMFVVGRMINWYMMKQSSSE